MFGTKEVETKVTDVLKHIADDTVKKVGKKHKTVEFDDGMIFYILSENQQ